MIMSRIWDELFSKNGLAAKEIAYELIGIEEGERIPRVEDFVNELKMGRGTVQGALRILEDLRAVTLESRGHLGTFMVKRNLHLLKEIAGVGELMGAMPLPYSTLYEGFATGLIEVSDKFIDNISLAYMRGSKQRIESLKARRYDFIVLSKLAAEDRKSTRLNSSHVAISYAVFCLKKKTKIQIISNKIHFLYYIIQFLYYTSFLIL